MDGLVSGRSKSRRRRDGRGRGRATFADRGDLRRRPSRYRGASPGGGRAAGGERGTRLEGRIRDEVERRVAEEVDRKVPELPEGISADGKVTPEGVANFLKLPAARESKDLQNTLDTLRGGRRTLLRGVTEENPYTQDAYAQSMPCARSSRRTEQLPRRRALRGPEGLYLQPIR